MNYEMNYDAISINASRQEVSVCCDNFLDAYRKLKDVIEEWATLVDEGLTTKDFYLSFLGKSTELQEEMRENADALVRVVNEFQDGLEDSGLSYY